MNKVTKVAISLGGNKGNVKKAFTKASMLLSEGGMRNIRLSSAYLTKPEGCAPGTPDFINAALCGEWFSNVESLHELTKSIEISSGRPADHARYSDRTLDIDIVLFGNSIIKTQSLSIPHREAANRLFVLVPLAEIAPDWIFPDSGKSSSELLKTLKASPLYNPSRYPLHL